MRFSFTLTTWLRLCRRPRERPLTLPQQNVQRAHLGWVPCYPPGWLRPSQGETMFRRISRTRQALAAAAAVAALALAACGGGGGGTSGTGTLSMSLTDAPACGFDQVNVTITDI